MKDTHLATATQNEVEQFKKLCMEEIALRNSTTEFLAAMAKQKTKNYMEIRAFWERMMQKYALPGYKELGEERLMMNLDFTSGHVELNSAPPPEKPFLYE